MAVIRNILKGWLGIDKSDTRSLLPENQVDETALHAMEKGHFSNWTLVKEACISGEHHSKFFQIQADEHLVIVHLDTDTRKEIGYEVHLPDEVSNTEHLDQLIENVSGKLREWLSPEHASKTVFAIAVEETEAWVFTLYSESHETGFHPSVKESLWKAIHATNQITKTEKKDILRSNDRHHQYALMSYRFRKKKILADSMKRNSSLAAFCEALTPYGEKAN